ncbi:hypothetical protein MBLNU13_g06669t1 [Cladosporium sp. NU13]
MLSKLTLLACLLALPAITNADPSPSVALENANYIFNSVHHAMRQWGSSLDHNGMSVFLATVPVSTEFYHGTSSPRAINGTQWLAFEPEHALNFANCGHGRPGKGGPPPPGGYAPDGKRPPPNRPGFRNQQSPLVGPPGGLGLDAKQRKREGSDPRDSVPDHSQSKVDEEPCAGYLHTYRTLRDLRLIYVDGQSAAKSDKGTLDVQDLILRTPGSHEQPPDQEPGRGPGGPPGDSLRALELCNSVKNEWEGKIDGILRMEAGFEVILCSFEDNLDVVSIKQQKIRQGGGPGSRDSGDQLSYYQAVAARFDGIGGNRVSVDYDSLVSVYAYANATYWDDASLPRVTNDSAITESIREDVKTTLTITTPTTTSETVDWQAVTDMIVGRYANRIASLSDGNMSSLPALQAGIDRALRPFIDYSNRNASSEVMRCAEQFLSPAAVSCDTTAAIAVKATHRRICQSLSDAAAAQTLDEGLDLIMHLKDWLGWTTWKRCAGCHVDEVCIIPIWPWGSKQDREQPRCSDMTDDQHGDYWGGFRGRMA